MKLLNKRYLFAFGLLTIIITLVAGCGSPETKKLKFFDRGKALYEQGEFAKAGLEFKNSLQIDPKFPDGWYWLGRVELKKGNFKAALGHFSKTVKLDPDHLDAHLELAKLWLAA